MAIGMISPSSSSSSSSCSSININMTLLCLLLLLQSTEGGRRDVDEVVASPTQITGADPAVNIYFNLQDLHPGFTSLFYFSASAVADVQFLSRAEAESIPFSPADLPALLRLFSFAPESPQAGAMESTLKQCELEPTIGELRFCATSLESMLDFVRSVLGPRPMIKLLTTKLVQRPKASLQNYTIWAAPKEIGASGIVACHTLPYPYAVFYCHSSSSSSHPHDQNRVFRIGVEGEDGARIDATAVCHMDTSHWDKDHVSFQVLHIHPGTKPVCHFLPADNLLWASF